LEIKRLGSLIEPEKLHNLQMEHSLDKKENVTIFISHLEDKHPKDDIKKYLQELKADLKISPIVEESMEIK